MSLFENVSVSRHQRRKNTWKSFMDSFNVRQGSDNHREAALLATDQTLHEASVFSLRLRRDKSTRQAHTDSHGQKRLKQQYACPVECEACSSGVVSTDGTGVDIFIVAQFQCSLTIVPDMCILGTLFPRRISCLRHD